VLLIKLFTHAMFKFLAPVSHASLSLIYLAFITLLQGPSSLIVCKRKLMTLNSKTWL
jgi:hypothetical protein